MILDPVGASYLADNQRVLNADGRLVLIGLMGGRSTELDLGRMLMKRQRLIGLMGGRSAELDLGRMLMKRQRLIGSTLRAKSPAAKGAILAALQTHVWPRLASGELEPLIDRTWPIAEAEAAHDHVKRDANIGKVLLSVSGED